MTTDPALPSPLSVQDKAVAGDRDDVRYRVLSVKAIWLAGGFIVVVGVGVAVWLLQAFGHGGEQARNQLEAIKTAGTIVVGAGGAVALLLAARRQRTAEIALKQKDRDQAHQERVAAETRTHQERVAAATEADAASRRITELYTKAADQLGSDKAPVRLSGMYALERLAQDNPDQRQTIVNVLCAYLRMPYQLPGDPPGDNAQREAREEYRDRVQEREVRLAAQRLFAVHLRPGNPKDPAVTFWHDIDLDLTGAILVDLDLHRCHVRDAIFHSAQFDGNAWFDMARFDGSAWFSEAQFDANAQFAATQFDANVHFGKAQFAGEAHFGKAQVAGDAWFSEAQFDGNAWFSEAQFDGDAWFSEAQFDGNALFGKARFADRAGFGKARFADRAGFGKVQFAGDARFDTAQFDGNAWFSEAQFAGDAGFNKARFADRAGFGKVQFAGDAWFGDARFDSDAGFDEARFGGMAEFVDTTFRQCPSLEGTSFEQGTPPELLPCISGAEASAVEAAAKVAKRDGLPPDAGATEQ